VALDEVKTLVVNGSSTVMSCDTVTIVRTWHDYKERRTPARAPWLIARHVVR
jgi:hypothetical protein